MIPDDQIKLTIPLAHPLEYSLSEIIEFKPQVAQCQSSSRSGVQDSS